MKLFQRRIYPEEIHQYVVDLKDIVALRDNADGTEERERYTNIIHVMQETLERLLEK